LPRIDFGLNPEFGSTSLDGDGPKREQTDIDAQIDEPQPATQVAPPSVRHLDDLVIPDGIGVLERISYGNRKKDEPQVAVFSYLFFDKQPRQSFPASNPRYPLYAYLALRKSFPYAGRYKTIVPAAEYFTEATYEPAESSKPYSYATNYPLVHIVLLEQFDPRKEIYNVARLFAPRLKVPTQDIYVSYAQDFQTNANSLLTEQSNPVEIAATFAKLLYPITLPNQQINIAQPERGTDKLTDGFSKIPTQIQGHEPIPQSPATLEANVRIIYKLQSTPRHEIYNINPYHQIRISPANNSIQQTQIFGPRIESRVAAFFAGRTYQEPYTRKTYRFYPGIAKPLEKRIRDYNRQKPDRSSEYKAGTDNTRKDGYSTNKDEDKNPADQKFANEIRYTKNSAKEAKEEKETKAENYIVENDNPDDKKESKNSATSYVAAVGLVAGAGLAALAGKTFSFFRRKKRKYNSVTEITNYQSKLVPIGASPTIDKVVAPAEHKRFNTIFKNNMATIVTELKSKAGYGKVGIYIQDNETGESYGLDENIQMPTPSLNKVAITFAAAYLAERGSLDTTKRISIDKEWVHNREIRYHPEYAKADTVFEYQGLRKSTNRESSNTEATHLLKLIGDGDIELGIKRVNDVLGEVGIQEIRINATYQRGQRYEDNVGTAKAITKLMTIVQSGQYLNEQHTREIMEDLEGTRTRDLKEQITDGFRDLFQTSEIGIKQTLWERGMGYTFYIGNKYSGTVVFDRPVDVLYKDEITARGDERKPTSIFEESRRYITKINNLLSQQLNPKNFKINISQKAA